MNKLTIKALVRKEFLNIIRDRKSFIILILIPLLMFPLMIGLITFFMSITTKVDNVITFGVNYEINEDFKNFIDNYAENYTINIINDTTNNLKEQFDDGTLNIYVIKNDNNYELHYDENKTTDIASTQIIKNLYEDYKEHYIGEELQSYGIDYENLKNSFNIEIVQESITEMGSLIPSIIATVLIMTISSVAFSIAIDVTTSEKEKGTLETLLSLPIKKSELIISKYITVFSLTFLSGLLSYFSLFITLILSKNTLSFLGVLSINIDIKVLILYLISIILLSLIFSGLLLSITIFSKNLKEAQNSLYPMEILVTVVSFLPLFGVKALNKYAIIPFVNISLLFNNALASNIDPSFIIITFLSSIVYSVLLVYLVSKIYSEEDILFNSKSLNYLTLINGKTKTKAFTPIGALLVAIIIYLLSYYFSLIFISSSKYVLLSITPLTIIIISIISMMLIKLDYKKNLKLNKFSIIKFLKLLPLYIGSYFLASFIVEIIANYFPTSGNNYSVLVDYISMPNIFISILLIALLPAIAEELLFRGILFNSFSKKFNVFIGILISSLIFGVYHMNIVQGVYAFLLGMVLAYSYYKSNTIFIPITIHFINNSLSVLMDYFKINSINYSTLSVILISIVSILLIIFSLYLNEKSKNDVK